MNNNQYNPFENNVPPNNQPPYGNQNPNYNQSGNQPPYGQNGYYGNQNPYYHQGNVPPQNHSGNNGGFNSGAQNGNNYNQNQQYNQPPQYNQNPNGYNSPRYNGQYAQQYNQYQPQYQQYQSSEEFQKQAEKQMKLKAQKKEIRFFGNIIGVSIIAYIVVQNIVAMMLSSFGLYDLYSSNSVFADTFNLLGVSFLAVAVPFGVMALINKKRYTVPIIPQNHISAKNCCLWVGFGMGCCIVANYAVSMLIQLFKMFGLELTQGSTPEPNSVFACIIALIATAVVPAICEEFAMRCCSLELIRKYGKAFGVVAVSIVFGLLHGNVIQFAFAFLVGLVLGYVTVKTDSIIPAVLIHGFNNGISVMQSIGTYSLGSKFGNGIIIGLYAFWFIVGVGATIYLGVKKYFVKTVDPYDAGDEPKLSMGQKLASFFFVPGMIFPFLYLIAITATTINKV